MNFTIQPDLLLAGTEIPVACSSDKAPVKRRSFSVNGDIHFMRHGVRGSAETDTERFHGGEPQDTAIETLARSKRKKGS